MSCNGLEKQYRHLIGRSEALFGLLFQNNSQLCWLMDMVPTVRGLGKRQGIACSKPFKKIRNQKSSKFFFTRRGSDARVMYSPNPDLHVTELYI